ncbi:MAG: CHAT domain-containing protein [Candidatus Krumholzibacteriia bacterium]
MRHLLLSPLLLLAATAWAADPDLAGRLAGLRADSRPDSVEVIVADRLPTAWALAESSTVQTLLLERGMTRVAYGRAIDGEPDLRAALAIADARRDAAASLRAVRYLAEACQHIGRRDDSAALFADLLQRARDAGDAFHAGKALYGLGRLRYRARDLAAADSLYALALPLLSAAADPASLAAVHNGRGACAAGRGEFRRAAEHYARAAAMARGGGSRSLEAMALNNLAGIESVLGDPGAAASGYRQARDIQRELGLWQQVGAPWRNLAQALTEQGRHDEARAELAAALAFCRERGFRDEAAFTLVRLAEVDLARGDFALALTRCQEVIDDSPAAELETVAVAQMRAADALLALGRGPEALARLAEAATALQRGDDFNLDMMLAAARGRTLLELGRPADAIAALQPSLSRAAASGVARYRLPLLVTAAEAWTALGAADSAGTCLDAAERLWEQERSLPADPEWRERRGADAQRLFALAIGRALADGDATAAFAAAQRYKARTLLERVLGPGSQLAAGPQLPPPVTLEHLGREVLRPGEVLLDVVAAPARGWLFAVSRDTCVVRSLPGEPAWSALIAPLLAGLANPFASFAADLASAARDTLLGPADSPVVALVRDAATVFVCPDGALHRVPFVVLLGDGDRRRVPSATLLAHLRARPATTDTAARVLAVAGRESADHRRLAGAAAEVADLQRRFRHVTAPAGVDTVAFGGLDPSLFDVLHLACHAEMDPQRPWNSALIFGTGDRPLSVRAAEIVQLDLTASLAVLSSCDSAAGAILAGEGMLGLAAGFLGAGVPAVVATLWPVDDLTTRRFVAAFYAALADGLAPPARWQRRAPP